MDSSTLLHLTELADKHELAPAQALPMLSEAELPPAVGLVLKLASESPLARAPAVSTQALVMSVIAVVSIISNVMPEQHTDAPELLPRQVPLCKLCLGGLEQIGCLL